MDGNKVWILAIDNTGVFEETTPKVVESQQTDTRGLDGTTSDVISKRKDETIFHGISITFKGRQKGEKFDLKGFCGGKGWNSFDGTLFVKIDDHERAA